MKLYILYFVVSLFVIGCSSVSDNQSTADTQSEFVGRWVLSDYTLDDGTMKPVPVSIQDEGAIGISVSSIGTMAVTHGLCESYQISYRLESDVLNTLDPVFPDGSCTAFYDDADNDERSELVAGTFLISQTLIAVSDNLLTVTTIQNEILNFERSTI